MCGICGFQTTADDRTADLGVLERMVQALRHRGPDENGVLVDDTAALGHARLSIIDLEGGKQPLFNEDGSVAVVANGEIYNFAALRADLESRGHRFRTRSDCEVITHLWEEEGPALLERLRGMFAFALLDRKRRVLFGARDRFGQKPLFYFNRPDCFVFASEIKALLEHPAVPRRVDIEALDRYLFYQFVPCPLTLFEDVRQLPPGHSFRLDLTSGELSLERYWQPSIEPHTEMSDEEHLEELEQVLADAVSSHMVSDVPVGLFLSGGIDSSLIAALAKRDRREPLHSFSIAFPGERQDESRFARLAARHAGTEHEEFPCTARQLAQHLEIVARAFDQPLADPAALPLFYLSEHVSRRLKVVLTGDGGDELFAGYPKYRRAVGPRSWASGLHARFPALFRASTLASCRADPLKLRRFHARLGLKLLPEQRIPYFKDFWEGWERFRLYSPAARHRVDAHAFEALDRSRPDGTDPSSLNRMLRLDQTSYLPDDLLLKTDYATMAHGLEARAPFLDHLLAEVAGRLPQHLKATHRQTKVALRCIARRLLPRELAERKKRGFAVPIERWFGDELEPWIRNVLVDTATTVPEYFRREVIEETIDQHTSGRHDRASKIYALLVFELWHRQYVAGEVRSSHAAPSRVPHALRAVPLPRTDPSE